MMFCFLKVGFSKEEDHKAESLKLLSSANKKESLKTYKCSTPSPHPQKRESALGQELNHPKTKNHLVKKGKTEISKTNP